MTGHPPPSDLELLWMMHERISHLSADLQQKYELRNIAEILAFYRASSIYSSHPILKKSPLNLRDASASYLHNVPLAIQCVSLYLDTNCSDG